MKPSVGLLIFVVAILPTITCVRGSSLLAQLFNVPETTAVAGATGGGKCAGCTLLVGIVEQLSVKYNTSVEAALEKFCNFLPGKFLVACKTLVAAYGPAVIEFLDKEETADVVCHAIGLCRIPPGTDMCHIFPLPPSSSLSKHHMSKHVQTLRQRALEVAKTHDLHALRESLEVGAFPDLCKWPAVDEICKIIDTWKEGRLPADDIDGDKFSDLQTARGTSWRGKDCNDSSSDAYPGRRPVDGDAVIDSNCNGIVGVDDATGTPYEDLWCNGTKQYGTVVLGDSIGAHLHTPPEWFNVSIMSKEAFDELPFVFTNEFDWPQLSMTTGHFNASKWSSVVQGPMDSLYQRIRNLNRCNHRDYQNIGVNGARASDMAKKIVSTIARNPANQPVMAILELIGNDVCRSQPGLAPMTTPQAFYDAQLETLRYLDAHLPAGSHILIGGLIHGLFLYETMSTRVHPIGALRGDVTYNDFYEYLICLGISPCWGYLNSNETWRNATMEHAELLNAELQKLVATEKFENFDLLYTVFSIEEDVVIVEKEGKQAWQIVEPVDGFHPSQLGNAVTCGQVWDKIQKSKPEWIPAENPHNDDIIRKFGDQGGY